VRWAAFPSAGEYKIASLNLVNALKLSDSSGADWQVHPEVQSKGRFANVSIVRHLMELHGGTVEAESLGEGQGATCTVRLPLLRSRAEQKARKGDPLRPVASPSPLVGLQILVVDDDADSQEFVTFLLEQAGAKVISSTSANEALMALTRFQPDVDGYTLLRQVRALPAEQGGHIPAIALTAYAGEIDYQQAMAAGFQRHIAKPVEPQKLIQVISSLHNFSEAAYKGLENRRG
jgi:CheY-like chemotaxis protein